MHITYLSIFPELFDSFRETTLISRAVKNKKLKFETINPRHFCEDKHRIVDDEIYGWGHGLLMKAPPIIAAVRHWMEKRNLKTSPSFLLLAERDDHKDKSPSSSYGEGLGWGLHEGPRVRSKKFLIILPHPSQDVFNQSHAHDRSEYSHLLFVCGRYEGIDERVWLWLQKNFPDHVVRVSLGQFVTLGWELPAMTMTEAVVRLIPWVINTEMSWIDESYSVDMNMENLEHPQYTRPEIVEDMSVPEVLLSGHHKKIEEWKRGESRRVEE